MAWGKNGDTVFLQKTSELVFSPKVYSSPRNVGWGTPTAAVSDLQIQVVVGV